MELEININFKVTSGKIIVSDDLSLFLSEPTSFNVDTVVNFYEKLNVFNPYVGNTILVCKYVDDAKKAIEFEHNLDFDIERNTNKNVLGEVSIDSRFLTVGDYETLRALLKLSCKEFKYFLEKANFDIQVFDVENGDYTGTLKVLNNTYHASIKIK